MVIRDVAFGAILTLLAVPGVQGQISFKVNRVIWVEATGTGSQNCAALRQTLNGIAGMTSGAQRYLVKLEPGQYSCGSVPVVIPSFVTVQGGGPEVTQITGRPDSADTGIVHFDNAESSGLRLVRVHHWSDTLHAVAISASASFVTLEQIDVFVQGSGQTSRAIWVTSPGPEPENQSGVRVRNSWIHSSISAIQTQETGGGSVWVDVFSSELNGAVYTFLGGSVRCAGSYEGATYDPLDQTCLPPP